MRYHPTVCLAGVTFALAMLLACTPQEIEAPMPSESAFLITGVSMVNPGENTVSPPRDILIDEGRVVEVAEAGGISPERATRHYSAKSLYALPGLLDVHAHLGDGGLGAQTDKDREGALAQFLHYGVTTIFVPGGGGGNDHNLAEWKLRCSSGELNCPGLYGSGALITAPGSHPLSTIWALAEDVDREVVYERGAVVLAAEEAAKPLIERKRALGADAIKIIIEDGPGPWYPKPRLSPSKIAELVEASHHLGLKVFAHVSALSHLEDAVAAGVDGVMHSVEDHIPDSLLEKMAEQGIFYVATLSLYDGFSDHARGQFEQEPFAVAGISQRALASLEDPGWRNRPADSLEEAEAMDRALRENLLRAFQAGVHLALGTDVNNPTVFPGYSVHEELALMVEAGLTPAEALAAATTGAASFLERAETLGCLRPGCEADLLILRENPLEDILNTRSLVTVIQDGLAVEGVVSAPSSER